MNPVPALPIPHRDLAAIRRRALRTAPVDALDRRPRHIRLWLPLSPFFLLLAPVALLLSPLGYLAPGRYRSKPVLAVLALGTLLLSLSGTEVAIDASDRHVLIKIL